MSELRDASATRWDLDRMFRRDGLVGPFTDGVTFADVDFEIERNDRFLVLEGKRDGQFLSVGQRRAMEARLRTGRTCVVFWGNPDEGMVHEIGTYAEHFPGSAGMKLIRRPADNKALRDLCAAWWSWADSQGPISVVRCAFDPAAVFVAGAA